MKRLFVAAAALFLVSSTMAARPWLWPPRQERWALASIAFDPQLLGTRLGNPPFLFPSKAACVERGEFSARTLAEGWDHAFICSRKK